MARAAGVKKKKAQSYHHGELRGALIAATEAILRKDGIEGFSLREAARLAGVSPGAPAHHFGNASGLLTEVALLAYEELAARLARAQTEAPAAHMRNLARLYVQFALDEPALFRLMFRKDLINRDDARYQAASQRALGGFARAALAVDGVEHDISDIENAAPHVIAAWSLAHGIAHLALEDKFGFALTARKNDFTKRLLPAILQAQWPDPTQERDDQ